MWKRLSVSQYCSAFLAVEISVLIPSVSSQTRPKFYNESDIFMTNLILDISPTVYLWHKLKIWHTQKDMLKGLFVKLMKIYTHIGIRDILHRKCNVNSFYLAIRSSSYVSFKYYLLWRKKKTTYDIFVTY